MTTVLIGVIAFAVGVVYGSWQTYAVMKPKVPHESE